LKNWEINQRSCSLYLIFPLWLSKFWKDDFYLLMAPLKKGSRETKKFNIIGATQKPRI